MQARTFAFVIAAMFILTAQQDAPLRGPGQFTAIASGALIGRVSGDASVTKFKDGRRELYLLLNSDQMMTSSIMVSATIKLSAPAGTLALTPTAANALIQWDNLSARTHRSAQATGSIDYKGRDTLTGKFSMTAKAGTETLALTGTFENASAIPGID